MIVAVESNFVIQLAFKQEEGVQAQTILGLGADGQVQLAIPACALFEPYETQIRRHKKRDSLLQEFQREINELARCTIFSDLSETSKTVTGTMAESAAIEAAALDDTIDQIARIATVIPLTNEIVTTATALRRQDYDLSPQDAIVFASIDSHLRTQEGAPKVFATKDAAGFMTPEIRAHFGAYNCRVIPSFADTLACIQHHRAEQAH